MSTVTYPLARNAAGKNAINAINAVLWGGLIAGALDATDGVVAYGFQGLDPVQVLQYIASGVLGPASFKGGLATRRAGHPASLPYRLRRGGGLPPGQPPDSGS